MMRPVPEYAVLSEPDHHVWGASMVRDAEGNCHLYYSRWPREKGFNAWVTHSEVAHAVADQPLGPYRFVDVALPARGPEWWDGFCTHNPTIRTHEGRYFLYYMGNTGDRSPAAGPKSLNWTHRNNQRIGVAVADSPYGPWERLDHPLIDVDPDPTSPDSLAVSNPTVTPRPGGGFLMIYKAVGRRDPLPFGGPVVHKAALSDYPEGPFIKQPGTLFTLGDVKFPAEDPYVWVQDRMYYALLKDMKGHFTGVHRSLVLFESGDGLDWHLAEHSLVSNREIRHADGRTVKYDYLERPQLYCEDGQPRVLFCAARLGDHSCNIHIPLSSDGD